MSTTTSPNPTYAAITTVGKCVYIFTVTNAIVLATLIVTAIAGGETTAFMWVRAIILMCVTGLLMRLVRNGLAGSPNALPRLKILTTVMPVAIIVVDFIPGLCPMWYAAIQGLGSAALLISGIALLRTRPITDEGLR